MEKLNIERVTFKMTNSDDVVIAANSRNIPVVLDALLNGGVENTETRVDTDDVLEYWEEEVHFSSTKGYYVNIGEMDTKHLFNAVRKEINSHSFAHLTTEEEFIAMLGVLAYRLHQESN